jgi:hypothetical protein
VTTLTIDLGTIRTTQAEMICGMILAFARANESGFTENEEATSEYIRESLARNVQAPPTISPAAAFGNIPTGKISEAGPSLEIPTPAGPVVVTTPPAPAGASVTLDKDGLPWDARIHASSKAQNADGTWRLKRGLAKDHLDKVTAELRQVMAIPAGGPQLVPPPPVNQAQPNQVPAVHSPVPAPPPPPVNEAETRDQFIALFNRVSAAISQGKLTQAQLDTCLNSIGIPSLPLLGARLDLVPQACALIDGVIAGASA